jgi:TrmH family RNA methyltransferase
MSKLIIKSTENLTFKVFRKLYMNKAFRNELLQSLLDGPHLIRTYIDSGGKIFELIKDASIESDEINLIIKDNPNVKIHSMQHDLFTKISGLSSVTGLMALINIPPSDSIELHGLCLLLDKIQDPGNLGGIIRTAAAVGVSSVFLSEGCSDVWSPKTLRGSQGSHFFLSCYENQNLENLIGLFEFPVYALSMKGESLYKTELPKNIAIILGSEGQGLSLKLLDKSTKTISIPMNQGIESLNVGSAASIIMYEYYRQSQSHVKA